MNRPEISLIMAETWTGMVTNVVSSAGLFGLRQPSYAKQTWYGGPNNPVYLSIFFNGNPKTTAWAKKQVIPGAIWTTGQKDPIELSTTNQNQRVLKRRGDTKFAAWLGNSTEQYHEYTVEYYSFPA